MDSSIFIPVIADNSKIDNLENPFAINGFILNAEFFYGILSAMQRKKTGWHMSVLSTEATGRPFWLLDWHNYDEVCAWFPFGENFNFEDVTLAYIVGVPCTPNLGYRDVDEWQPALPDEDFNNIEHRHYSRIRLQTYFGGYEVRTIESKGHTWTIPHPCQNVLTKEGVGIKRPRTETSTTKDLTSRPLQQQMADSGNSVNMATAMKKKSMVRITNWVYFCRVILKLTDESRSTCLWMITMDKASSAVNR
ncbi:uncharacterized protein LOC113296684 isoform X2 [Papaver somniferum]|nr:uncharacterized protein LOC113296684 isoform X2 [Papaver somniferum]